MIPPRSETGTLHFNPLPPHGGRRYAMVSGADSSSFQSTPSAWRETCQVDAICSAFHISIHSLRMEGDRFLFAIILLTKYFNPLPPHGGRPVVQSGAGACQGKFQSTPSAWRETERSCAQPRAICISIHSLRMEGDASDELRFLMLRDISIHSLRMEGDVWTEWSLKM